MSDTGLLLVAIIILITSVVILLTTRLHIYINKDGIYVKFFPFQIRYKLYDWNSIQSINFTKLNPLKVGYGFRLSMDATKYYNVSGNRWLRLSLMNGRKTLIGTRQADEMKEVLMKLGKTELMKNG